MKTEIPIIFSSNDYFVPYTAVMIQSIMENSNKIDLYKIFILHHGITDKIAERLVEQVKTFPNFSIDLIDVRKYITGLKLYISRHITIETYFRLFIPYILNNYNKVLYFDGDMICLNDVAELYNKKIDNNLIAAVRDISLPHYYHSKKNKKFLSFYTVMTNLSCPEKYFNAGMLVWNTKLFRETISYNDLINLLQSRDWPVHDQDILNFICNEKVYLLSYKWNLMSQNPQYLPESLENDYIESQKNPKIIHFKPYKSWYFTPYSEFFWKYAAHSKFFDDIISTMIKENYFSFSMEKSIIRDIINSDTFGVFFFVKCLWLCSYKKIKNIFRLRI
jgi:lipopolysaccharide biosynthesis glycosyltransferase